MLEFFIVGFVVSWFPLLRSDLIQSFDSFHLPSLLLLVPAIARNKALDPGQVLLGRSAVF